MAFTVPDAHLLALQAHEGQVDKQGRDYYLAHLRPIAESLRPYGPLAEMAGALHDIVEDTRDLPEPDRRYDVDRLRALACPRPWWRPSTPSPVGRAATSPATSAGRPPTRSAAW